MSLELLFGGSVQGNKEHNEEIKEINRWVVIELRIQFLKFEFSCQYIVTNGFCGCIIFKRFNTTNIYPVHPLNLFLVL